MSNSKQNRLDELLRLSAIQAGRKIELPQQSNEKDKEEYILTLNEFMEQSAEQCRFLEAESARLKIMELKENLNDNKTVELKEKHNEEQGDIEKAHEDELKQFNQFWNEKISEYIQQSDKLIEEMKERHNEECQQYRQELNQGLPTRTKDSNRLLDMKSKREMLSRQKQYIDAHLVHQEIEKMEQQEQEQFEQERKHKIQQQINHLVSKQQQELNALQLKIRKGQEEQEINRNLELERLMLKYKVVKKDISNRQCIEKNFLQKAQKNPGINNSKYFASSRMSQSRSRI